MSDLVLRWCYACPVVHAENCPECFGFGKHKAEQGAMSGIISAGEIVSDGEWVRCGVCGGTPNGSDKAPKLQDVSR